MGKPTRLASLLLLQLMTAATEAAERRLTGEEIRVMLTDRIFRHADNSQVVLQTFRDKGVTYYYEGSEQTEGRWEVRGDKYCSQWPPRKARTCYNVMAEENVLTFISATGVRYPVETVQ